MIVFGQIDSEEKDFTSVCYQSTIILAGFVWSTFILLCKLRRIEISGGSSSKRQILSTIDLQLMTFFFKRYLFLF